jgi:hypothetical protein
MKKFLLRLSEKPTPQFPAHVLRHADHYFRAGRHRRGRRGHVPVSEQMEATALILWARRELNEWYATYRYDGIQAAIALGY